VTDIRDRGPFQRQGRYGCELDDHPPTALEQARTYSNYFWDARLGRVIVSAGFHDEKGHHGSEQNKRGNQLGETHRACRKQPTLVSTKALNEQAGGAMKNEIPEEDLSLKFSLGVNKQEDAEDDEAAQGMVELGGVQGNIQGC
jgi:hypothetical protein